MRSFEYQTLDVFTSQRFGGNPLAVIPDARGLTGAEMQAIAREFNYSETTFVLPPADPANTAQVRIFTPVNELPFAGHPNVGTGYVLGKLGRAADGLMRFEEGAGLVEVRLTEGGEGASIRAPKALRVGPEVDPAAVAACLSVAGGDVVSANHRPCAVSVGLPFIFVEVASLAVLAGVRVDAAAFAAAFARYPQVGERFSTFAYVRTGPRAIQARMFAPLLDLPEDPATGSACGAAGGLLASLEPATDGVLVYDIAQGVEMGRPSRIQVTATKAGGAVTDVRIAGRCVPVMRGVLEI